jgi:hypothetical protein
MPNYSHVSTGWKSLDMIIDNLRKGDNVVWQVDSIDDYRRVVSPFVNSTLGRNERVVYLRFGGHTALLEERANLSVYQLKVENSFESFSSRIHSIITREGRDVHYVFDSLSDLLYQWATDQMISDFFFVTCPYLFELNTIAYFAILRNNHSFKAIARIREITQVLIDVYNFKGKICVHPIKVQHRYSPTMFFPHIKEKDQLVPVINSVETTELFSQLSHRNTVGAQRHLDYWDRLFLQAKHLLDSRAGEAERRDMVRQLSRLMLTRNEKLLGLIEKHFSLEDLLQVKERFIGTGFIGGKTLGMLLSRKILEKDGSFGWEDILENHDSFYIGSDIFYSYIVQNGWWHKFMAQKTREGYFSKASEMKKEMLNGLFPEETMEQFKLMLEYFGQSPIIVRSSSLLEDAFGSAFAGKYDSFFCVNQGSPEKRFTNFIKAVRLIFASTMSEDALSYRLQRGLDKVDEQMALLVQRVSGSYHKSYFFPELAGVGLSYNPFVWKQGMEAKEGMIRLVFGLGTRAVNRIENDYPRIVSIDAPLVKPLVGMKDLWKYSQHFVDLLNLEENQLETVPLSELLEKEVPEKLDFIGIRNSEAIQTMKDLGRTDKDFWILTFDPFLMKTPFIAVMRRMLRKLEQTYHNPVEIEFALNFNPKGDMQVNLLQCRPFQTREYNGDEIIPKTIPESRTIIRMGGNFMGDNTLLEISRIIFIDPGAYVDLSMSEKYSVARLIGKLNKLTTTREQVPILLMGPGRWGTHTPAMGIPVSFSEINHASAIAEISYQTGSLIPDLSFGTHFFHDLIESRIFYMAIYPENPDVIFNLKWIRALPNLLDSLIPESSRFSHVVKVADTSGVELKIQPDIVNQTVICYISSSKQQITSDTPFNKLIP